MNEIFKYSDKLKNFKNKCNNNKIYKKICDSHIGKKYECSLYEHLYKAAVLC